MQFSVRRKKCNRHITTASIKYNLSNTDFQKHSDLAGNTDIVLIEASQLVKAKMMNKKCVSFCQVYTFMLLLHLLKD